MSFTVNLNMDLYNCSCGITYAVPSSLAPHRRECPACATRKIRELESERDERIDDLCEKDRKIAALKGVITKLKGRE